MVAYNDYRDSPVLIVGFGVAGIAQCHTFIANGFSNVTVVEADDSFGGVWNLNKQWPGLQAQNTKFDFEFPEMSHTPGEYDDYPTQEQVHQYLQKYIRKFDLEKYVTYGARVESLRREAVANKLRGEEYEFTAVFSQPVRGTLERTYSFVVCATGFTSVPRIPSYLDDGGRRPDGVTVLHTSEIRREIATDPTFGEGKRVVVLGSGKSAMDAACWAVSAGAEAVDLLLSKPPHAVPQYPVPSRDKVEGLVEYNRISCRVMSWLLPCEPEAVRRRGSLPLMQYFFKSTWLGKTICNFLWKMRFEEFRMIAGLPSDVTTPLDELPYSKHSHRMCSYPADYARFVNEGKIRVRVGARATGFHGTNGHLTIVTKEKEEDSSMHYDIVLCGTGFDNSFAFLSSDIQKDLYNKYGQAQIYRGVYCPYLPQMAFNGIHMNLNSMFASAMAARWIAELAKGPAGCLMPTLLSQDAMLSSMEAGLDFERKEYDEKRDFQANAPGVYTTGWSISLYADCILTDLGSTHIWRSPGGMIGNLFGHVKSSHYKGVITEKFH